MQIETFEITDDINTFCLAADSPLAIPATFEKLEHLVSGFAGRRVYGVGGCSNGKFFYKACTTERAPGEATSLNLPYFTIPKGKYLCATLSNWRQNVMKITGIIDQLFEHPDAKKGSNCIEDYCAENKMRIMIEHV